jgi:tetraacyldisaccharide 4'-kinase
MLQDQGRTPWVLSRGYKALADGRNEEAQLLSCPVVCNPSRCEGARQAIKQGADCLILDDGFQHRKIARDLNLVCIDASRPWGRPTGRMGATFPLGRLRENPSALKRADAIILTRCDQAPFEDLQKALLLKWRLPVFRSSHQANRLEHLGSGQTAPLSWLSGRQVMAAAGIGQPQAFAQTLRGLGAEILKLHAFPDHHHYTEKDAKNLIDQCQGRPLIITAKDAVKLRALIPTEVPCWVLQVALALDPSDAAHLSDMVQRVLAGLPPSRCAAYCQSVRR